MSAIADNAKVLADDASGNSNSDANALLVVEISEKYVGQIL
jgi:hypothetical protein